MAWHASSRRTIGFIDGISSSDISVLSRTLGTLTHASNSLAHPLTVPEIFLHCIVVNLNERVRIPAEESFYDEEIRTGLNIVVLAPGALEHGIWNWRYEDFQTSTARANKYATTVAYLKRRFNFALGVTKRLLEVLEEMEGYDYVEEGVKEMLSVQSWSRRERLLNRKMALEGHEHQCDCMQLRVNNLISVVGFQHCNHTNSLTTLKTQLYTIPTQLSARQSSHLSRINLRIAHAVRTDSIPVRTIAYVTLVFLPGAFVSSIFGMNFFDYEAETSRLRVSASFWQYWAITVPVTLCVLLLWNVWVWREKRKGSEGAGGGEGLAWEGDVAEEVAMAGKI
ncbi:hypothetical protein M011DRAFT_113649 [Sporormia fimetaria CBS 119925]|uniref:Uncharacterized protein n=1 Tax=Sporormia fimetaria CBS 119925 TaxID=1340428 RepID=A0A6A6VLG6_9PLEO|nr:hypothetical protein M011DRAFT_113649 [Sporormia fimetaria CBS 119925]